MAFIQANVESNAEKKQRDEKNIDQQQLRHEPHLRTEAIIYKI